MHGIGDDFAFLDCLLQARSYSLTRKGLKVSFERMSAASLAKSDRNRIYFECSRPVLIFEHFIGIVKIRRQYYAWELETIDVRRFTGKRYTLRCSSLSVDSCCLALAAAVYLSTCTGRVVAVWRIAQFSVVVGEQGGKVSCQIRSLFSDTNIVV